MTAVVETRTGTTTPTAIKPPTEGFFYSVLLTEIHVTYFRAEKFKRRAITKARFEVLEDGSIYAEIPECPGVWAKSKTRVKCREELKRVLSEWVDLKCSDGDKDFPIIEGINLNV